MCGDMKSSIRTPEEVDLCVTYLLSQVKELKQQVRDHTERFDTLQTSLWKRILFRIDGWPGQTDLNAERPSWRPWRRWWRS